MSVFQVLVRNKKILISLSVVLFVGGLSLLPHFTKTQKDKVNVDITSKKSSRVAGRTTSYSERKIDSSQEARLVQDELNVLLDDALKKELKKSEIWYKHYKSDFERNGADFYSRDRKVLSKLLTDLNENSLDEYLGSWGEAQIDSRFLKLLGYYSINNYSELSKLEDFLSGSDNLVGKNSGEPISNYLMAQGEREFAQRYPEFASGDKKLISSKTPLESEVFMDYITENLPQHEEVLNRVRLSASTSSTERSAYEKLHECTYSTYLNDEQRQNLLNLFITEPDITPLEALKEIESN